MNGTIKLRNLTKKYKQKKKIQSLLITLKLGSADEGPPRTFFFW